MPEAKAFVETFYGKEHKIAIYDQSHFWISDERRQQVEIYRFEDRSSRDNIFSSSSTLDESYRSIAQQWQEEWPLNVQAEKVGLDADTREQLQSIGYIE